MNIAKRLEDCHLDRGAPFAISNVSQTQLSIARHFGGIKFHGHCYTYNPEADELVRNDVLRWLKKQDKIQTS